MNNESEKPGEEKTWSMPEPVFRSSEGKGLRSLSVNEEILRSDEPVGSTPETNMENEPKKVAEATTDPEGESAVGKHVRGDSLSLSMTAIGLLSLAIVAILFLLYYFLFVANGNDQVLP